MSESMKQHLDGANPNTLADSFRILGLGGMLRALPTALRQKVPAADSSQLSTVQSIGLSKEAPAATILRAYARSGGGTLGEMVVDGYTGTAPADGHIAIAPNGDIVVVAASAYTALDVDYIPMKGDVISLTLAVVSNDMTLPDFVAKAPAGAIYLLSATSNAGTLTGALRILVPAAGAPATGKANLDVAKLKVKFAVADAVTNATVQLLMVSAKDVDALMSAASTVI